MEFDWMAEKYHLPKTFENTMVFRTVASVLKISEQPGCIVSSLTSRLPFAAFFFLPLFTIFITLTYIRKKYTYTDNLIFSFHNQSLLFILLIVSFLIDLIFNVESSGVFLLIFAVYLYKGLRKFYGENRFKTILKFLFLNAIFVILAGVSTFLLVLGSVVTY